LIGPTSLFSCADEVRGSRIRSKFALTAAASMSVPSWNFTPGRSRKVQTVPSAFTSQAAARAGL
jgi:hypothetical protein